MSGDWPNFIRIVHHSTHQVAKHRVVLNWAGPTFLGPLPHRIPPDTHNNIQEGVPGLDAFNLELKGQAVIGLQKGLGLKRSKLPPPHVALGRDSSRTYHHGPKSLTYSQLEQRQPSLPHTQSDPGLRQEIHIVAWLPTETGRSLDRSFETIVPVPSEAVRPIWVGLKFEAVPWCRGLRTADIGA